MPGALGSRLTGLAVMWAALLGFVLVELQPLWTLLYSRWHAEYVGGSPTMSRRGPELAGGAPSQS